jgi:hypothetical protein
MGSSIEVLREQMTFLLEQGLHDSAEMLVGVCRLLCFALLCFRGFVVGGRIETCVVHFGWQGNFLMSLVSTNGELSSSSRAESMVMTFLRVECCFLQSIGKFVGRDTMAISFCSSLDGWLNMG